MVNEIQQHAKTPEHKAGDSGAQDTAQLAKANLQGAADSLRQQNGNVSEGAAMATAQKTVDQHFGTLEIVGGGAPKESAQAATAGAPKSAETPSGGTNKPADSNNKPTEQSADGRTNTGEAATTGGTKQDALNIKTSDVNQTGSGDCYFMSGLASMAGSSKGQEKIKDMIKTNGDGSYTVTFAGDKNNPVNVTSKDIDDRIKTGQVNNKADWANVVETAFLKYDQIGQDAHGKSQDQGILAKVNDSSTALQLLTGESTSTDSLGLISYDNKELTIGNTSKENVQNAIETALKNGEPIVAGATTGVVPGSNNSGPLEGKHEYSVTGFNAETGMVTVRNPWGTNNGTKVAEVGKTIDGVTSLADGQLEMSMDTFSKRFNSISFAGKNSTVNDMENVTRDEGHNVINAAVCGKDVLTGNFGKLGSDLLNFAKGEMQTVSDKWYGRVDSSELAVKSVIVQSANASPGADNFD